MSKVSAKSRVSVPILVARKKKGERISMVTCYDAAFGRLVDASPVDIILVGDSLGNVMMGYDDTIRVTVDDMVHHTACVSRVVQRAMICADLPFLSYHTGVEEAVKNAGRLVQEAGAQAVKLEGGKVRGTVIEAIVAAGIPVMGHLGLTPQSVHQLGGYRVQGKGKEEAKRLIADARALEEAGVFAIVLELIPQELAARVTEALTVPTIGIGAGAQCDGQVLVLHDLLGFDESFSPKFLKRFGNLGQQVTDALSEYDKEVKGGIYPSESHSFSE